MRKNLRDKLNKAINENDYESIYQIEESYLKLNQDNLTEEDDIEDLLAELPEDYFLWSEIKKANYHLQSMTLKDIMDNLKEFYWINHQYPKVLFILKSGEKIKTPLTDKQENILLTKVSQISIKIITEHTKETYISMF